MAQSPVIYALVNKRARMAGELAELERRASRVRADLVHIDVTLQLFGADPSEVAAISPIPRRSTYFPNGGIGRTCLKALRLAAGKPLSAHDIAENIMSDMGLPLDDTSLRRDFVRRVQWALVNLRKRGLALPSGGYRSVVWVLVDICAEMET